MQQTQGVVGIADLPELAEGGLEIVVDDGQIVGVFGGLRFLERGKFADQISAALIHVVSEHVRPEPSFTSGRAAMSSAVM